MYQVVYIRIKNIKTSRWSLTIEYFMKWNKHFVKCEIKLTLIEIKQTQYIP